jgi:hypothetical protein
MRSFVLFSAAGLVMLTASAAPAQVYGDNAALVDYWYRTFLGRAPDAAMAGWVNALNQGQPADQVLSGILASPEFYNRGGATPQGFITLLYSTILQRAPTPAELDFWIRRMYTEDRQAIADEILKQNPGVWVSSNTPVVTPPVVPAPGIDWQRHREWERDRRWDWDRRHGVYEYRRLDFHVHRDEHHDRR